MSEVITVTTENELIINSKIMSVGVPYTFKWNEEKWYAFKSTSGAIELGLSIDSDTLRRDSK